MSPTGISTSSRMDGISNLIQLPSCPDLEPALRTFNSAISRLRLPVGKSARIQGELLDSINVAVKLGVAWRKNGPKVASHCELEFPYWPSGGEEVRGEWQSRPTKARDASSTRRTFPKRIKLSPPTALLRRLLNCPAGLYCRAVAKVNG
jgi:hypothetical protein